MIDCTVDRVEEGHAVCISDADGSVFVLSERESSGLCEGVHVRLSEDGDGNCSVCEISSESKTSKNGERLRRLFNKNNK